MDDGLGLERAPSPLLTPEGKNRVHEVMRVERETFLKKASRPTGLRLAMAMPVSEYVQRIVEHEEDIKGFALFPAYSAFLHRLAERLNAEASQW